MSKTPTDIVKVHEGLADVLGNVTYGNDKIGVDHVVFDWVVPSKARKGKPVVAVVLIRDTAKSEEPGYEFRQAQLVIAATYVHDETDPQQHRHAVLEAMRIALAISDAIKQAMQAPADNGLAGITLIEDRQPGIEPRGHEDADRVGWVGQNWDAHYFRATT